MHIVQAVPPHVRYLVFVSLRDETLHVHVEDAETVNVAFFRMTTHELLSDANAEDGLRQGTNHLVEPSLAKVAHRARGLALTGEDDAIRTPKLLGRIGQKGFNTHSLQSMNDRKDIAGIVFYDCELHLKFTI